MGNKMFELEEIVKLIVELPHCKHEVEHWEAKWHAPGSACGGRTHSVDLSKNSPSIVTSFSTEHEDKF